MHTLLIHLKRGFLGCLIIGGLLQNACAQESKKTAALKPGLEAVVEFETPADQAILMDAETGAILFEKNARVPMEPASMTKIMTAYLAFEDLKTGRLRLTDTLPVSEKAWRKGGSRMFIDVGSRVKVEELIRGVIVVSGNDASIALAEGLGGTEESFAKRMTERAAELGALDTHFINASGWPEEGHYTTAYDLAVIARHVIEDFPEYYPYFSEMEFEWNNIKQPNRHPLLGKGLGVDGLKTGHTEEAYGLVASGMREETRLILVINGCKSMKERAQASEALLSWGFRNFKNYHLFKAGESVEIVPVWLGEKSQVSLAVAEDIALVLSRAARKGLKVEITYPDPLPAPLKKGEKVGTLTLSAPSLAPQSYPLVVSEGVDKIGILGRLWATIEHVIWGKSGR